VRPALGDENLPHRAAAVNARFAFAPIDAMFHLEPAALALRVHVVGNRRPAQFDGMRQNPADGRVQPFGAHAAQAGGARQRMDPGGEQTLICVDVPYPGQEALVQQQSLHPSLTAQPHAEFFKGNLQRLRPQPRHPRRAPGTPFDAAELARVVIQQDAVIESENSVGVGVNRPGYQQLPGHSQMHG